MAASDAEPRHAHLRPPLGGRRQRSPKPAWVQIEEQLADRIEAGALAPGERLPPERDLAPALGVSRMTVRQALASLAARGLVERGVGRGTFVPRRRAASSTTSRASPASPRRSSARGWPPGARILSRARVRGPGPRRRGARRSRRGAAVLRIERVRLGGDRPIALEDTWLPAALFPGLLERGPRAARSTRSCATRYDLGPVERDRAARAGRRARRTRPRRSGSPRARR